jgi:hypothetical protein
VYDGPSATINGISVRVTGDVNDLGEICCGGPSLCPGPTYPWFMTWYANIQAFDGSSGKWAASYPGYLQQLGAFDETGIAENQGGFMSLTTGDVLNVSLFFGRANWLGECDLIRTPAGTMASVTVIMDISTMSDPLPVSESTWGKIKALYR